MNEDSKIVAVLMEIGLSREQAIEAVREAQRAQLALAAMELANFLVAEAFAPPAAPADDAQEEA